MKTCSIQLNQLNFKNPVNLSKANYKICQADVSYESFSENTEISNNISIYKIKPFSGCACRLSGEPRPGKTRQEAPKDQYPTIKTAIFAHHP